MRDVIEQLSQWRGQNEELAVTTVVETWGSAPRPVGSKMIVTKSGGIAGSVSAGCVEGAVIDESSEVINSGEPRLIEYGVADETAWSVGLACGGRIKIFIEPGFSLDNIFTGIQENFASGIPFLTVTSLEGKEAYKNKKLLVDREGNRIGDLSLPESESTMLQDALSLLASEKSGTLKAQDGTTLFVEVHPLPPQLLIIGAVHLADPLVRIANILGFETIIIDPRSAFATPDRYPHVGQLILSWPDEALQDLNLGSSSYIVVLTHDPKLDDPALIYALRSEAGYIGALGSQRTNQKRQTRLKKAGLTDEQLSRLHAPIGIDLGGRATEEIAVSIMAQIIQVRNKGN